jgi:hypothetical protein
MVLFTLHLIALNPHSTVPGFISDLRTAGVTPRFQARVLRWMILPSKISTGHLLGRNKSWDLLVGLEGDTAIPSSASDKHIDALWTVTSGVSAAHVREYENVNKGLYEKIACGEQPVARLPPKSATSSSQSLEMSDEVHDWISRIVPSAFRNSPVSMLNLLSFNEGKSDQYRLYGAEFSKRVGSKHGGHVKIVGRVVNKKEEGWDEIAFVHYPSLNNFASMLVDGNYQEVNKKYRLGALRDTFILCTVEVGDDGMPLVGGNQVKEKL